MDGYVHVFSDIYISASGMMKTHGFFLNIEIKTMRRNNSC